MLVEKAEVVKDEVTHHTDTILEKGAEKLEEIIEAGGELAIKADKHLSDTKTTISQNIKETSSDFDEGIMTAVNKLKNA